MQASLTIEVGEGAPRVCELQRDRTVTLGRHRSNTIVLQDKHASRWHAEIYADAGRWMIRDCGTLNGTRIDGQRIQEPTPLVDGHTIAIGDTRLRVCVNGATLAEAATRIVEDVANGVSPKPGPRVAPPSDVVTVLDADELTALCRFMSDAVGEASFQELVQLALETVYRQTKATLTGFL